MVFLVLLWCSLFFASLVLLALIIDTAIDGAPRFDPDLITNYDSTLRPRRTGLPRRHPRHALADDQHRGARGAAGDRRRGLPEEFADRRRWYNRVIEVNLQNLAAVPSIVYGLLAVACMAVPRLPSAGIVLGGAIALALLILPVIIITTREAIRAVPNEIRFGSLALGATVWQTTWRQILPSAVPGIATGTILGLSRAIGEAAPLLMLGTRSRFRFDPDGVLSQLTALPMQIFFMTSQSQDAYQQAAAAAIIVLLVMVLALNGLAIFIRNKFQRSLVRHVPSPDHHDQPQPRRHTSRHVTGGTA